MKAKLRIMGWLTLPGLPGLSSRKLSLGQFRVWEPALRLARGKLISTREIGHGRSRVNLHRKNGCSLYKAWRLSPPFPVAQSGVR